MKVYFQSMLLCIFLPLAVLGQCDTLVIPQSDYTIVKAFHIDSASLPVNCTDGDPQTHWHTAYQGNVDFPHEIWIHLGGYYNVQGFRYLPRQTGTRNGKLANYAFYVAMDTNDWNIPEKVNTFTYQSANDIGWKTAYFGSTFGQYIRLVANSQWPGGNFVVISELEVLMNTCNVSTRTNQIITMSDIPKKTTTDPPFRLDGVSTSGLPVYYRVMHGPAMVSHDTVYLTGQPGTVTIAAYQPGNADYYPADTVYKSFEVIDLQAYKPQLTVSITGAYPLVMPVLRPYWIYARATIDEPDFLHITSVTFDIGGVTPDTLFREGEAYGIFWTPPAYGTYQVTVTAIANNGRDTTAVISVEVVDSARQREAMTFDHELVAVWTTGQTRYGSFTLPQFVGGYDSIHAYLDITCPSGGCDPYDRVAWIEVEDPSGNWVQIIRYITPFGIGCSHDVDVTPYTSLLQGNVNMRVYISTWSNGWEVSLRLKYFPGNPAYPYSRVFEIWDGGYPFGDPANLQPVDTVKFKVPENTLAAYLLLSNTGHGWGQNNTGNAAEFYHARHKVLINDSVYIQDLWYDCNPNPDGCTGQLGTWQYDRAGWCPGAISPPDIWNLNAFLPFDTLTLSYVFQEDYVDLCHPNNPDCVSGVTCQDCNDGFNPIYYVDGQILAYGNTPFIPEQLPSSTHTDEIRVEAPVQIRIFPNPASNAFSIRTTRNIESPVTVTIYNLLGRQEMQRVFARSSGLEKAQFDVSGLPAGVYLIHVNFSQQLLSGKLHILH